MIAASGAFACFIGELPDELLVNIVVQLRIERGFLAEEEAERQRLCKNAMVVRSLHALTLSCRKLKAIATPFLYQSIIQTPGGLFMPLFFRTLFDKPILGRYVRYIEYTSLEDCDIGHFNSDHDHFTECLDHVCRSELHVSLESELDLGDRAGAASSRVITRLTASRTVHRSVATYSSSALLVVLSMTENLQEAALPDRRAILTALIIRSGRLRQLWLKSDGSSTGLSTRQPYALRVITSNPEDNRRHLPHYLRRFCMLKENWITLEPLPAMEEISLTVIDVDSIDIDDHLEDCASLKRFSCQWQWTDSFVPLETVNLPHLRRSLQRVCKTLTHLTIDTSESASRVDLDRGIPPLGSLCEFETLRYLNVAGLVLWGDDDLVDPLPLSSLLPKSLETLVIKVEWDDDVEDALHELGFDCANALPSLKTVECTWRPVPKSIADYLTRSFRIVHVDLVLAIEENKSHDLETGRQ